MQEFTADLKHRMRGVWRDAELVDPNTHNNKLATYHSWFAIPLSRDERMSINLPRYLHLFKHVMRNISRFRLRALTLKVEAAAWLEDGVCVCDQCLGWRWTCSERGACSFILPRPSSLWAEETFFLSVNTFFWRLLNSPTLLLQQVNNQLVHDFLSQQPEQKTFFLFWALWIYLWLAETSQQPISQTTWLKHTPHCNQCNHNSSTEVGHPHAQSAPTSYQTTLPCN